MKEANKVIGTFVQVGFPEFGIADIKAKIDTGAYRGALHCTKIRLEEKKGKKTLHFSPFDHPEVKIKSDDFTVRHVTSSNGKTEDRYFIETSIAIAGQDYPIVLSLANRSEMKWPVLIGRRFLRQNNFLVDARQYKP